MTENGKIVRVSNEMFDLLKETAMKNETSIRSISKDLAKEMKQTIKDKKIVKEIKF